MNTLKNYSGLATLAILAVLSASCDQRSKIEERNRAALIRINEELFAKGNLDFANEAIAASYTYPGFSQKGPDLIKTYVADLKKAFPDLKYKMGQTFADGNLVAWSRTHSGTHSADFMGLKPSGKQVNWTEYDVTRFDEDGKIVEEWGASDFDDMVRNSAGIEGVYEYITPLKGQSTPADGKTPMKGEAGTYTINGEKITCTFLYSNDAKAVGTSFSWKVKSWSGDTVTYVTYNNKGEMTGEGRSVRKSN